MSTKRGSKVALPALPACVAVKTLNVPAVQIESLGGTTSNMETNSFSTLKMRHGPLAIFTAIFSSTFVVFVA